MNVSACPIRDADVHAQENHTALIQQNIADIEESPIDVLEAFSQCSVAKLSYEQEEQIYKAYVDGDSAELGNIIHQLIKNQIKEMATAISNNG